MDSLTHLALSIHTDPGIYALLTGSGISRSAGVPTGWEVVQDLLRKVAVLHGQDPTTDLEAWYKATYHKEADYSNLLDELGKNPEERRQILRGYFEPTDEDREEGRRVPTPAHRAIADLMKNGFIRVLITTNFDRLQEIALADVGIQATVVTTADATKGMLPLAHQKTLVVKINGDYLDSRIKNTVRELDHYDPELNTLLDRVFDEFGLIVCGWSGDWDTALRRAVERCPTRRFSTFWCARGTPATKANDLINLCQAIVVPIVSADAMFTGLAEKVAVLRDLAAQHPISGKIAAAQVKRYIVRPEDRIRLHDLVHAETERAYSRMDLKIIRDPGPSDDNTEFNARVKAYNGLLTTLLPMMTSGAFWAEPEYSYLWRGIVARLGDPPGSRGGITAWIQLRHYPATVLMYATRVASVLSRRFYDLASVLRAPVSSATGQKPMMAVSQLNDAHTVGSFAKYLPGMATRRTPFSDYIHDLLKVELAEFIRPDEDYSFSFELFEYLAGVTA